MQSNIPRSSKNARLAIRNTVFGLSAIVTQLIGNSFAFFVIARIPGVSVIDFGILTYAFASAQLFAICFEYGMTPYLAKESAAMRKRNYEFERAGYGLHLGLMCLGYALFVIALPFLNLNEIAMAVCKWIGASVFVTSTLRFFLAYYQGRERLHLEFLASFSEMVVLISVISVAYVQNADILTIAKFFFFGRFIAWIFAYIIFGIADFWLLPKFNRGVWKKILLEALPFGLTFLIAFAITSIDTIMLQWLAPANPEYQVGLYQAALRLILIPTILAMVATKVFLPQLSRMGGDNPNSIALNLRYLNNFLQTIGLMAGVFVIYHAKELVSLAYGKQYIDATALVRILGLTMMLRFGAAYNLYFTLKGRMWLRVSFAIIALLFTVIFNYMLIPSCGVIGVAYASVLTHLIYWVPFLVAIKIYEGDFFLGWHIHRSILAGFFFSVLLALTDKLPFALNLIWSILFISFVGYFSIHHSLRVQFSAGVFWRK